MRHCAHCGRPLREGRDCPCWEFQPKPYTREEKAKLAVLFLLFGCTLTSAIVLFFANTAVGIAAMAITTLIFVLVFLLFVQEIMQ